MGITYNMLSDGIDVAINAMGNKHKILIMIINQLSVIVHKKQIDNMDISDVTNNYIDEKFKIVDVNLNFVLSLV